MLDRTMDKTRELGKQAIHHNSTQIKNPHRHRDVEGAQKWPELIQHLLGGLDRKIRAASPNRVLQNVLQILGDENEAVRLVFVVQANLQQLVKGFPWQLQVC